MQIKKSPRELAYGAFPPLEDEHKTNERPDADAAVRAEQFGQRAAARPAGTVQRQPSAMSSEDGPQASAPAPTTVSLVDRHSSFDGHFETDNDLRVEGQISGEVVCRGLLTIEREATARARIQAKDVYILGRVEGDIVCAGRLALASSAHVTGTLKAGVLVVEEGAMVSGTVDTTNKAAKPSASNGSETPEGRSNGGRQARRDLPSFAIVSSEERVASEVP